MGFKFRKAGGGGGGGGEGGQFDNDTKKILRIFPIEIQWKQLIESFRLAMKL